MGFTSKTTNITMTDIQKTTRQKKLYLDNKKQQHRLYHKLYTQIPYENNHQLYRNNILDEIYEEILEIFDILEKYEKTGKIDFATYNFEFSSYRANLNSKESKRQLLEKFYTQDNNKSSQHSTNSKKCDFNFDKPSKTRKSTNPSKNYTITYFQLRDLLRILNLDINILTDFEPKIGKNLNN